MNHQGLQCADKSYFPPSVEPLSSRHTTLTCMSLPFPKLPIKTNLFFWEIKPAFVKEWYWLQVYHCVYFMSHSISLSWPLALTPTPHFATALWPPPASHWRMICSCRKGSSIIWLVCALDIYMGECMISSGKFNSLAFSVIACGATFSSGFHQLRRERESDLPTWFLWPSPAIAQQSSFTVYHLHGQSENMTKTRIKDTLVPCCAM